MDEITNRVKKGATAGARPQQILVVIMEAAPAVTPIGSQQFSPHSGCCLGFVSQRCCLGFISQSMGNLVSMPVDRYLYMGRCTCLCVGMYMCMDMIVSCTFIFAHIAFVCPYDYVQRCEDTVTVELCYIIIKLIYYYYHYYYYYYDYYCCCCCCCCCFCYYHYYYYH